MAPAAALCKRNGSVAIGWLKSDHQAVRLAAADGLFRNRATWAIAELIDALDDPLLINRQFARMGIEKMLSIRLTDFGYRFYMDPDERRKPLIRLRLHWFRKRKKTISN